MNDAQYHKLLDTISITLDCLGATVTDYVPELGTVQQSIWNEKELQSFKKQLRGLMSQLPTAEQILSE